eukprot:CCRYP_005537-RC/>CCRYP_005537-RC protein AED:0.22 eAED:0.22 QI:177/1/1/1/1/1/3/888/691
MFKGPKAILSSAIANALGTYFEVDANAIESNLVRDAKIVLNDVRLKKQVSRLPLNSAGNATIFTVTGGVETVEFKWDWSVGFGAQQLVKNAVLSIKEANFECELEHDVLQDVENSSHSIDASSFVNIETIDAVTEQVIKEEAGGIMGYVMRQVNMVIDTLTLKIDGLDFRIILPPAVALGNDAVGRQRGSPKTIFICADELKLISFGRKDKDGRQLTLDSDESKSIVQQRLTIRSFLLSIVRDGVDGGSTAEYPIIDPFSYTADVTKAGKRFGGMMHGLEVSGCVELTTSSRRLNLQQDSDSLVLYIGEQQIDALMQLSVMVLAPPSDVNLSERAQLEEKFDASVVAHSSIGESTSFASSPSSFHFPLSSASLILFDYTHAIHVSGIDLQYKADGTVCKATASKIDYESEIGGRASCLDIILTARPVRKLKFGLIQSLHIPNKLELTNPISPEISFEGNVLIIRIEEAVDVVVYGSSSSSPEVTPTDNATPLPQAPCAVDAFFKEITIKKDLDGSSMKVKSIEFYANPVKDCNCTQIAIKCLDFKNHLAQLTKLEMSCSLPMNEVNTVNEFNLSVQKAEVKGGKSSEEWSEGFRPRPTSDTTKSDKHTPPTVIRLPFAKIATLKLLITWSGTGISMKDTSISIKPFLGTAKTTTNDLITYYTSACLAKFPQFISNAEVLGINLVDQVSVSY